MRQKPERSSDASHTRVGASRTEDRPFPITVLLCTMGRRDMLVATVKSVLSATGISRCDELLIIDQSLDDSTEKAVLPFLDHPAVYYVRSHVPGKGKALNLGLEWARNELIAITDDDVEVCDDWLAGHLDVFQRFPKVAMTYGQVLPIAFDESAGFIPIYLLDQDNHVRGISDKVRARGIGANTVVRRSIVRQLGGFDIALGPGGKFHACVDGDMTVRCLLAGYEVYETAQSKVYHAGFRTWQQGRKLASNAFYGIGAAYAKPLKCGYWQTLPIPAHEFFVHAVWPLLHSTVRGRPQGWLRVRSFLQGFIEGWRSPVDKQTLLFKVP